MFAVGDIVRVIAEPPADRRGARWVFIPDMDYSCGQEAEIYGVEERFIGENIIYGYKLNFNSDIGFCLYEKEWLIPIKVTEPITEEQFDEDFGALVSGVF